ncbi:MAG: 3'-5' exonuclease [Calditrichaeota bacterium]|nr:MAG: 3'-5' exonuclease [Calditrichota bacterium]
MGRIEQQSFNFEENESRDILRRLELKRPLVFFDLETTGLDFSRDRIVQFAFLRINPDRSQDEWTALVNPGMAIPADAVQVHQITDAMVADKPLFKEYAPQIFNFINHCDLCGFNIINFDVPFLQVEMERNGYSISIQSIRILDAQVIYHKNEPRNLAAAFRFYCHGEHTQAHDAMADVRATLAVLNAQLERYTDIPSEMDGLHAYCNQRDNRFVTVDRKFMWKNDEAVLSFGKHRGKSVQWLVENEKDYLLWMKNGDFSDETKKLIEQAFLGIFPQKKSENES